MKKKMNSGIKRYILIHYFFICNVFLNFLISFHSIDLGLFPIFFLIKSLVLSILILFLIDPETLFFLQLFFYFHPIDFVKNKFDHLKFQSF
jgi:hypothetical protein